MNPEDKRVVFDNDQYPAQLAYMPKKAGMSLMSRTIMTFSGGIISTERQAQVALAILAIMILFFSAAMFLKATEHPVPISTNIIEVAIPRN